MINPYPILLLVPIVIYILFKTENLNIDTRKFTAGFFILLLLAIPPSFSFQPAFADNTIRQVIKIHDTYPADSASHIVSIDPPLENIDKAFVFYTVSHTGENDASDTFKSVEIVDVNTLRLKGEDTATGNNAIDFVAYIIEFDGDSEIDVQHLQESLSATTGAQTFTMGSVNTTNSMIISRGLHINASVTAVGNNDFNRIRIVDPTTWEVNIDTAPDTPEAQAVSIVDWNQTDISVQSGLFTMVNPSLTGELIGGTDFTAIDPTRTMFLFTYTSDGASGEDNDDLMLRGSLTDGGDIRFSREDDDSELLVAWQLIEFPADFIKIKHFNSTLIDTELSIDVAVPEIKDYSKTMALSHGGSPFGYSTGTGDNAGEVAGGIDRSQSMFLVLNNTRVQLSRDDSTAFTEIGWQLIEFLEEDVAENAQGTNTLRQVVKFEGEYITGGDTAQLFTISPALQNVNKTILWMTVRDQYDGTEDVSERMKRWGILNTTHIKIHGSNDPAVTNAGLNFSATLVEFDSSSPIFVQRDQVQYPHDISSDELIMHMSPVNASGSNLFYNSWTSTFGDVTLGQEEFATVRIINGSTWGYSVETPSDDQESIAVVNIVDWNQNNISVQRGQSTLSGTSLTVSPPTDVIRNQTILLSTFRTSNAEFEDEPDDAGLFAHLDDSSPPNIIFERFNGTDAGLLINWELISFQSDFTTIQHVIHNQTAGTSNATETVNSVGNLTNAFAIGTVGTPMGYANGKGSESTTDSFGEISGTMDIEDSTTVRLVRGQSAGSWDVGFQVVEFLTAVAPVQDVTITDTVTIAPEDLIFDINKTAVDFSSYVDVSTNKNITKLGTDIASTVDTVNSNAIFVLELNDQGEATDVLAFNITKLNQEVVSGLDDLDFDIQKGLVDSATVLDQVSPELIALLLLTDLASTTDDVRLAITKIFEDDVVTSDEINFVVDKLLQDPVLVSDLADAVASFGIDELDLVTVDDLVILDVTKQLSDVASIFDDLNLQATKVLLDTASIVDSSQASKDSGVNQTDVVSGSEDIVFDVTKLIQNIAGIQDQVVIIRELNLAVNDTVIVNDPAIFFTIATVIPNGTGTPASSGGGIPSGLPTFQRLVGLNIISELFFVEPKDVVPSDFIINTFGRETSVVSIIEIKASQEFVSWFDFSSFPDPLDFETTVDSSRTSNDPARYQNTALDDFVLNIPNLDCSEVDPFATPVPCIDPIIYEVPLTFTFKKGGAEFKERHIVTVDASTPIVCDPICQFIAFITENYWWLAGILIMFMMLYFLGGVVKSKGIRTTRRINKSHFNSFEATGRKQVRTKFKKGKRR